MPFYPLTDQTKNSKKWKKQWEIWSFYTSAPKIMIILHCLRWCATDAIVIFQIGLFSAPFNCLIYSPKNENFKKMKKVPGDIIILHKCTKNYDHVLYCSWDMACMKLSFILGYFCPFTPLIAQKNKMSKKWK